jgi:tetratricopeptide (TPR) repeat protein
LPPGGDERVHPPANRQVRLQLHVLGEIVEDDERRSGEPAQAAPDLLHLVRFIRLFIEFDAGGLTDLRDQGGQALIGIHPIDAACINRPKPVRIFNGKLRLPQPARAGNNGFAREDGCGVAEETIMEIPERSHPPDELLAQRNSGARRFGNDASALVARLGGLPLALELAKGYLNYRKNLTISALLKEMSANTEIELLNEFAKEYRNHLPSRHETDIVRTFQLSWEAAPETGRGILRAMGELAPVAVPRSLLRPVLKLSANSDVHDPLDRALDELARLSLVELDTSGNPIAHRLILAFARHRNAVDSASPFQQCLDAIQEQMDQADLRPDASTICTLNLLVPHAEFLLEGSPIRPEDFSELADRLGTHYHALGRYSDAWRAKAGALASAEKAFEPGHPSIAARQSSLAVLLRYQGQLQEASNLLRKALASDEQTYEPGHPSIAIRQSNLALVLQDLGQLEEARDLLRKALASDEQTFEPGHASIAIRQSNLATVLRDLGQLEEARDLLRKALASNEETFEPGHPSIAIIQSNLATVLHDLGQLEEASDLLRKALASNEKTFEPGHPSITTRQSNLAMVLKDLGELEEAHDLLRQALASAEKTFEPGHPSIATIQSNLATVLKELGQLEEARDLLRKALDSDEKTFKPGHPVIARRQSSLAVVLKDLGQLEEARDLLRKAHRA